MQKQRSITAIVISVALFPVWFPLCCLAVAIAAQFDRTREWARWLGEAGRLYRYGGFTLIELSIVLVIIGLVVGGVLVGQNLIRAASVRAQISQIERYNAAVNTFYGKYAFLPGDIPAVPAAQFGFASRGAYAGEGDGNGIIEGVDANAASSNAGWYETAGELPLFWADLATAKLIEGSFPSATATTPATSYGPFNSYFPYGKLGTNSYVYVFSTGGVNYFALSNLSAIGPFSTYGIQAISVAQAYAIDSKIDDGLPESGRVLAAFVGQYGPGWVLDLGVESIYNSNPPLSPMNTFYTYSPSPTSCTDNGNGQAPLHYSITQNNGNGVNCGLSFKFQ